MVKPKLPSVRPVPERKCAWCGIALASLSDCVREREYIGAIIDGKSCCVRCWRHVSNDLGELKRAAYLYLGLEPGGTREQSGLDFDITEFLAVGDWSSPYVTSPWRKALMGMKWNDNNGGSHASEQ